MSQSADHSRYTLFFDEIPDRARARFGLKTYYQAKIKQTLPKNTISVPNGFGISSKAFADFISFNNLHDTITSLLKEIHPDDVTGLKKHAQKIRLAISHSLLPPTLELEAEKAFNKLTRNNKNSSVIVRPSLYTDEDSEDTFAGQHDSVFNVTTLEQLYEAILTVYASIYSDRAISYRAIRKLKHDHVLVSISVQHQVRADKKDGSAGTLFTYDIQTHLRQFCVIHGSFGLGKKVVDGLAEPDEFIFFKPGLESNKPALIYKSHGLFKKRKRFCLDTDTALTLAQTAITIEKKYKKPIHLEWARDGITGKMHIVQVSVKSLSEKHQQTITTYKIKSSKNEVVATGTAVGTKISQGPAHVITDIKKIDTFKKGEVLVTDMTNPDWEPILKKAAAIVTDTGGRTAHAAIISREMGIPAIVGTDIATKAIKTGQKITIDCTNGDMGLVYNGIVPFSITNTQTKKLKDLKTKLYVNVGEPSQAFQHALLPSDGVGLARVEFIINESIKVHPLALLHPDKITSPTTKKRIKQRMSSRGYEDPREFFINGLASGIAKIAAAFYPRQVIVRLSDYKSDEYRHLIGGDEFEPFEPNPMLGWRGAARFYDKKFADAFAIECAAFRRVRETFGIDNITLLVPFVRTTEEGKKVLAALKKNGITKTRSSWRIYMMVEVPSNIILIDDFAKIFDGFSIGTNDLTQLTLGVDRGSQLVSHVYDERNEAVKQMISHVIKRAHAHNKPIGICGQAPSDFPRFAKFIAQEGIDSISVNPDVLLTTREHIAKV